MQKVDWNATLKGMGCHIVAEHQLLVCQEVRCQHAIDPWDLTSHVKSHGHDISAARVRDLVATHHLVGMEDFYKNRWFGVAVPGVKVIDLLLFCGVEGCETVCESIKVLDGHFERVHGSRDLVFGVHGPYQAVFGDSGYVDAVRVDGDSFWAGEQGLREYEDSS
jgi:hypothetical protein